MRTTTPGQGLVSFPDRASVVCAATGLTTAAEAAANPIFNADLRSELDPENETVGEGGALPLESADSAGAGHGANTEEAQRGVQGEGSVGGGERRPDGGRAGESFRGSSEPDL